MARLRSPDPGPSECPGQGRGLGTPHRLGATPACAHHRLGGWAGGRREGKGRRPGGPEHPACLRGLRSETPNAWGSQPPCQGNGAGAQRLG